MAKFVRENPTIVFGLGLPLGMALMFLALSGVPRLLVAPPQHDLIYATGIYDQTGGLQLSVIDSRLQATYVTPAHRHQQNTKIWRFDPASGAVREIPVLLSAALKSQLAKQLTTDPAQVYTDIEIPELTGVKLDPSSIAPDGYAFNATSAYSGGVFSGLFYASRHRRQAHISKDGRSILLPDTTGNYYSHNVQFLGWVTGP